MDWIAGLVCWTGLRDWIDDTHVSPSQICALYSLALKCRHRKLRNLDTLVTTLNARRLEKVRRRLRYNLNVPSYGEPLGEAIL